MSKRMLLDVFLASAGGLLLPVTAADDEIDLRWVGEAQHVALSFGNKDYNSAPFRLNSIWVSPKESLRTHEVLLGILGEVESIEIRSLMHSQKRFPVTQEDFSQLRHLLRSTSPRGERHSWPISGREDVFIVLIGKQGNEITMSRDTPGLLWLFAGSGAAQSYRQIVSRYIPGVVDEIP